MQQIEDTFIVDINPPPQIITLKINCQNTKATEIFQSE